MKKDLSVLYFTRAYTTHDHRFLTFLISEGFRVLFLTLEKDTLPKEKRFLPEGVEILPTPKSPTNKLEIIIIFTNHLKKIIKKYQPDIIHAGPIQTCAFITSLTDFHPFIAMSWGSDMLIDANKSLFSKWITKYTLSKADSFIGDCLAVEQKAIGFGIDDNKLTIFPWGINLNKFSTNSSNENLRKKFGWQNNFIVLHSRSWESIYNVERFIKGFIDACKYNSNLRLLLLGNGSLSTQIKSLIHIANLEGKVQFIGHVGQENLTDYYQNADIYVSASLSDGSSVSLMEALACGLPCLVSDIPGNREWIETNKQGWLFDPFSTEEIKNGLLNAANQKELSSFKNEARKLAELKADWSINSKDILKAYSNALGRSI